MVAFCCHLRLMKHRARQHLIIPAAMLCFNEVFGKTYEVDPVEALEPAAFAERWPKNEFIFDNQTHHVDVEPDWYKNSEEGRLAAGFLSKLRPGFAEGYRVQCLIEAARQAHASGRWVAVAAPKAAAGT